MEETKGTTNKGRKFNPKSNIKWLREIWDCSQEQMNSFIDTFH